MESLGTSAGRVHWGRDLALLAGLLAMVMAAFVANGYGVGFDDHSIHLAYLQRTMDPAALPGDLLFEAGRSHLSLFWILQAPLVKAFGLEATYAVLHVLSWGLALAGLAVLARRLDAELRPWTTLAGLALVPALFAPTCFGDLQTMDTLVLNRTVVLGLELLSLAFAVQGRGFASLLLAGIAANIHVTTALHTAVVDGVVLLLAGPGRPRRIAAASLGGLLGIVPLLVIAAAGAAALHPAAGPLADDTTWRAAVERAFPFHHFVSWFHRRDLVALLVPSLAVLAAARVTGRRAWLGILAGVYVLCLANLVATELLHLRIGVMLHLYQAGRLLTCVGFVATAVVYLRVGRGAGARSLAAAALLAVSWLQAFTSTLEIPAVDWSCLLAIALAVGVLFVVKPGAGGEPAAPRRIPAWTLVPVGLLLAAVLHVIRGPDSGLVWDVEGSDQVHGDQWCRADFLPHDAALPSREICGTPLMAWSAQHLPANARVIVPPVFTNPLASFRTRTGRSVVVTFKDGGEATFDRAFAAEWLRRLDALTGGLPPLPREHTWDGFAATLDETLRRYHDGDLARFTAIQKAYGATHLLCERALPCGSLPLRIVYEDAAWRLFELPHA